MVEERAKRKLTAILSADVKGYSRLMGEDELSTVETLKKYREIISSLVQQYSGRVVDSPGDNILTEFSSVVDALECAVKIQGDLQEKNASLPENRRMEFRIGVNLGDVIDDEGRIYGDGVNVAARVEGLAEGGGICISRTAFDQVKNKLNLGYENLGEHSVKNITEPVRVYKVLMEPEYAGKIVGEEKPKPKQWRWAAIAIGFIIVAGALAIWNFYFRPPPIEPASVEKMAFPLPEKPSIAVLPFLNMSEDPKQEYFSDGLTEEIITTLSKVSDLFVVARQSTFSYKSKPVKVQQVAEELGVRYVLEGSVRKGDDRVRITAQLIDALTGHHLWAEGYDRELKDVLAVQGDITKEIITALQVQLTKGEQALVFARGTDNVEAWALGAKAWRFFAKTTKENNAKARQLMERGIELDPHYALLWTHLGGTHLLDSRFGWAKSRAESLKRAVECVKKAITLDEENPIAHSMMANIYLFQRQYEKGITEGERAISVDPNYADGYARLAQVMLYSGRFEEALTLMKKAIRLCPMPRVWYPKILSQAYIHLEIYEEAILVLKKLLERCRRGECPPHWAQTGLIISYIKLGREEEARAEAKEILRVNPTYSLEQFCKAHFYKDPAHLEWIFSALRKAGLPETPPLPLPDKPSIAVLPFVNMSDDPKQEYFSDGITEEIITALSKIEQMFVIARNSTFNYKGKQVRVQQVAEELGVRYVLEGSVRRSGDKVRITAQLVDAITGSHLWAERYDRELKDIFAVQDEITMKIITALRVKLTYGEQSRVLERHTNNLQAYLKILEGYQYFGGAKFAKAMEYFEEALALDPKNPVIYAAIAWTHTMNVWFGPSATRARSLQKAFEFAEKCKALDDELDIGHMILGNVYLMKREYDKAISEGRRAVELNPNSPDSAIFFGQTLRYIGKYENAVREYERAIRLNPHQTEWPLTQLGTTYVMMRRPEEAVVTCKEVVQHSPRNFAAYITLAMAYGALDRLDEARAAASEALKLVPNFSVDDFEKALPCKNEADRVFMADALRKAGLK